MDSLARALEGVRTRIAKTGTRRLNEQDTKATLIEPVLRALGWDTEDVDEVAREYRLKSHHKPVDYGLLALRTPRLFVEAKALGENLDDHKWTSQIMGYAGVAGVGWIVLTDGNEYRIYNSHAPVAVEEKLLRSVRVMQQDPLVEETLDLLSKARLEENRLEVLWRAHFVDRQVRVAVEDLFSSDNDMLIVNHVLGRTKNLSAEEVRASLRRCKMNLDFPVSTEVVLIGTAPKPPRESSREGEPRKEVAYHGVSVRDLIDAGLLRPPVELTKKYKGRELSARILLDGSVECLGERYQSLSSAGGAARASIVGRRSGGAYPQTDGWTFWKYKAADGRVVEVDHARQAFLRARGRAG